MAAVIHLMRHGEVENPRRVVYASLAGFGLSARGRAEATASAERLGRRPVEAIYTSPLERAVETAELVALPHRLVPIVEQGLTEWLLADRWKGVVWEELATQFPGELEAYLSDPGQLTFSPESLEELAARAADAVRRAAASATAEIVVVSHQDPIQAARLSLTGRRLDLLNLDKPAHASLISLVASSPWRELASWRPRLPSQHSASGDPPEVTDAWPPVQPRISASKSGAEVPST